MQNFISIQNSMIWVPINNLQKYRGRKGKSEFSERLKTRIVFAYNFFQDNF
jgi:hypothetical protein